MSSDETRYKGKMWYLRVCRIVQRVIFFSIQLCTCITNIKLLVKTLQWNELDRIVKYTERVLMFSPLNFEALKFVKKNIKIWYSLSNSNLRHSKLSVIQTRTMVSSAWKSLQKCLHNSSSSLIRGHRIIEGKITQLPKGRNNSRNNSQLIQLLKLHIFPKDLKVMQKTNLLHQYAWKAAGCRAKPFQFESLKELSPTSSKTKKNNVNYHALIHSVNIQVFPRT